MNSKYSSLLVTRCLRWKTSLNFQFRTFFTKSPSNEPGFLLFDQISQSQLQLPHSNSIIEKHSFISKTNSVLRLQNQEIPNVKTCLLAHELRPNFSSNATSFHFPSNSPSYRSQLLKESLQNVLLKALAVPMSTAGNVFKHRKRKMNKHKYKKRMREQRLKASKNQTFRPYVAQKKE